MISLIIQEHVGQAILQMSILKTTNETLVNAYKEAINTWNATGVLHLM